MTAGLHRRRRFAAHFAASAALAVTLAWLPVAHAGRQAEEYMAPSVVAGLAAAVADQPVPAD